MNIRVLLEKNIYSCVDKIRVIGEIVFFVVVESNKHDKNEENGNKNSNNGNNINNENNNDNKNKNK